MTRERLYLFDTTLRDSQQTPGVDFSLEDKLAIIGLLDQFHRRLGAVVAERASKQRVRTGEGIIVLVADADRRIKALGQLL